MNKDMIFGDKARQKLFTGVTKLADAVRVTMGPRGRNVLIKKAYGNPHITKDGVTVATSVELKDPVENTGAQLVKEVASNTADSAGDGTTSSIVLAHAIFTEGLRNVTAGASPISIQRGISKATAAVVLQLKQLSNDVNDRDKIEQVATISANYDTSIGNMIADAMEEVGKHGIITVEESNSMEDTLVVTKGMAFDRGYLSNYFITDKDKSICDLGNPLILVTDYKIPSLNDIVSILEASKASGRPLLIIADDIESEALSNLVLNSLKGILKIAIVKAPGYGDRKKEILKDIAILTGAKFITEDTSMKLSKTTIDDLGTSSRVIISKNDTVIVDGAGDKKDVLTRINDIKTSIFLSDSDYDKEKLQERVAKLSGGVAVIKVGASTEIEMKERKDRVDDALGATKAAIEEGIVIGGGSALVKVLNTIDLDLTGDEEIGGNILLRAISAPIKQIATNAGYDGGVVINTVRNLDANMGFDASTGEYVDMKDAGIIDPVKVTRVALQNAASVASMLLTTEVTMIETEEHTL